MSLRMQIAVLIPCFNEEATVAQVVREFRAALPEAEIVVFDNNSTDNTVERARQAGARVEFERRQGKGFVVRQMFQSIEADIYVMVDGDSTYPSHAVHRLIEPILNDRADMVVGSRLHAGSRSEFRLLNRLGNYFFASLFRVIFNATVTDILSGYRAFSRRFVRDIPLFGGGFEIEAELTVKTLQRGFRLVEVPVDLVPRPAHSHSKIRIFHDGFVILSTIVALVRDYKPLTVFGGLGLLLGLAGAVPATGVIRDYFSSGALTRPVAALIALWLLSLGTIFIVAGFILHSVSRHFQELTYRVLRLEGSVAKAAEPAAKAVKITSHVR
jgi:glycosyltransferase involved in cell wall biosynthesis